MQEIWKDVEGYEGFYKISNVGRLKSYHRGKEKIIKYGVDKYGYCNVVICKHGTRKNMKLHRLVADAFIDNENNYDQINHKDENKLNNRYDNLEFCTTKYNQNYGSRTERSANSRSKIVLQILDGNIIQEFESTADVKRKLGYNQGHVSECCREHKIGYGYMWEYKYNTN